MVGKGTSLAAVSKILDDINVTSFSIRKRGGRISVRLATREFVAESSGYTLWDALNATVLSAIEKISANE
jgi:hypothetical protein